MACRQPGPRLARGSRRPARVPIHQLPVGFAPGTNAIYHVLAESEARRQAAIAVAMADHPLTAATPVQVTVEGVEAVVALAALPEFLAGVDIGVSVAIVIGSARYRFANTRVVQDWSRELPGRRAHADAFPVRQATDHGTARIVRTGAQGEDKEPAPALLQRLRDLGWEATRQAFAKGEVDGAANPLLRFVADPRVWTNNLVAQATFAAAPTYTPQQFGSVVHGDFAAIMAQMATAGLLYGSTAKDAETSAIDGRITMYGSPNSVRADFVLRDREGTIKAIYDVKTGMAQLSTARVDTLIAQFHAPAGTPVFSFSLSASKVNL